ARLIGGNLQGPRSGPARRTTSAFPTIGRRRRCRSQRPVGPACAEGPGPDTVATGPGRGRVSVPVEGRARLVLEHSGLEEVLLLLQVHRLRYPRERVVDLGEHRWQSQLVTPAVGDEVHVLRAQLGVEPQDAAGHGVAAVGDL